MTAEHCNFARVGESSGGIVGLAAALAHRARLSSLALCDTPFKRSATIAGGFQVIGYEHETKNA